MSEFKGTKIELSNQDWLLIVAALNVVTPFLQAELQTKIAELGQYIKEKTFASAWKEE